MQIQPSSGALPELRSELKLFKTAPSAQGERQWVIYDPFRHRYFQLGDEDIDLMGLLLFGSVDAIKSRQPNVNESKLRSLIQFLKDNELLKTAHDKGEIVGSYGHHLLGDKIAKSFAIKLPLVHPQRFLANTLPYVRFIGTPFFFSIWTLTTLIGIYLSIRQWDTFILAASTITLSNALIAFSLTLVCVKLLHELGHAYIAVAKGAIVSSMGMMFYFYFPVLYTDTTDVWRLRNREDRQLVDLGGIFVEILIAGLATFFWAILPDGEARSIAFYFATTSWLMSILINLNPLAKFDGYYLLCDVMGRENLQEQSFQALKKRLERLLFEAASEPHSLNKAYDPFLIFYGIAAIAYRACLLGGVILSIYILISKPLAAICLLFFIQRFLYQPTARICREWGKGGMKMSKQFRLTSLLSLLLVLAILTLPIDTTVSANAVLISHQDWAIHSPETGKIEHAYVKNGDLVKKGQLLFKVNAPELAMKRHAENIRRLTIEDRLSRAPGDAQDLSMNQILNNELLKSQIMIEGQERRQESMALVAPASGTMTDMSDGIYNNRWIAPSLMLGRIISRNEPRVIAFVDAGDAIRVHPGSAATLIFDDGLKESQRFVVSEVSNEALEYIESPEVLSANGGGIHANEIRPNVYKPVNAYKKVTLTLAHSRQNALKIDHISRGTVIIDAQPTSIAAYIVSRLKYVMIREFSE